MTMRILAIILFLTGFTALSRAVTFEEANEMLHAGNAAAAATAYEQLIAQGIKSSAVYANLGRALQQQGKIATASLNYHRALMLDPRRQEARQGLVELGEKTGLTAFSPRWTDRVVARVSLFSLLIIGGIFFWIGAAGLIATIFRNPRKSSSLILSIFCLGIGAFLLGIGRWGDPRVASANLAIVTADQGSSALSQPVETSASVASLPSGSSVVVLSEQDNWNYCRLPNGSMGWIPVSSLSFVNPEHAPERS